LKQKSITLGSYTTQTFHFINKENNSSILDDTNTNNSITKEIIIDDKLSLYIEIKYRDSDLIIEKINKLRKYEHFISLKNSYNYNLKGEEKFNYSHELINSYHIILGGIDAKNLNSASLKLSLYEILNRKVGKINLDSIIFINNQSIFS